MKGAEIQCVTRALSIKLPLLPVGLGVFVFKSCTLQTSAFAQFDVCYTGTRSVSRFWILSHWSGGQYSVSKNECPLDKPEGYCGTSSGNMILVVAYARNCCNSVKFPVKCHLFLRTCEPLYHFNNVNSHDHKKLKLIKPKTYVS